MIINKDKESKNTKEKNTLTPNSKKSFKTYVLNKELFYDIDSKKYFLIEKSEKIDHEADLFGRIKPKFDSDRTGKASYPERIKHKTLNKINDKIDMSLYRPQSGKFEGYSQFPRPLSSPFTNTPKNCNKINKLIKNDKRLIKTAKNRIIFNLKSNRGLNYLSGPVETNNNDIDKKKIINKIDKCLKKIHHDLNVLDKNNQKLENENKDRILTKLRNVILSNSNYEINGRKLEKPEKKFINRYIINRLSISRWPLEKYKNENDKTNSLYQKVYYQNNTRNKYHSNSSNRNIISLKKNREITKILNNNRNQIIKRNNRNYQNKNKEKNIIPLLKIDWSDLSGRSWHSNKNDLKNCSFNGFDIKNSNNLSERKRRTIKSAFHNCHETIFARNINKFQERFREFRSLDANVLLDDERIDGFLGKKSYRPKGFKGLSFNLSHNENIMFLEEIINLSKKENSLLEGFKSIKAIDKSNELFARLKKRRKKIPTSGDNYKKDIVFYKLVNPEWVKLEEEKVKIIPKEVDSPKELKKLRINVRNQYANKVINYSKYHS